MKLVKHYSISLQLLMYCILYNITYLFSTINMLFN